MYVKDSVKFPTWSTINVLQTRKGIYPVHGKTHVTEDIPQSKIFIQVTLAHKIGNKIES